MLCSKITNDVLFVSFFSQASTRYFFSIIKILDSSVELKIITIGNLLDFFDIKNFVDS